MTNQHPIVPPPELVQKWTSLANEEEGYEVWNCFALWAAQWGADRELDACCEWLTNARNHSLTWEEATNYSTTLRAARRLKPPSLAVEALKALNSGNVNATADAAKSIRRALKRLQELENNQ